MATTEEITGEAPGTSTELDLNYIAKEQVEASKVREEASQFKESSDKALRRLTTRYGRPLKVNSPEQMAAYLRDEALKESPNKKLLLTSSANDFFQYAARSDFGYRPKVNAPIYNLDAFREGHKRSLAQAEALANYEASLQNNTAPPDLAYIGVTPLQEGEKAPLILIPKWKQPGEKQSHVLDTFSARSAGTLQGGLASTELPEDLRLLQQRTKGLSDEELKSIEAEELLGYRVASRAALANFDQSFGGHKYRPDEVLVYLAAVSGERHAVNLKAFEEDFFAAYTEILSQEAGFRSLGEANPRIGGKMSPSQFASLMEEAKERARADVRRLQQQGRKGSLYIDDPNKLVRDIAAGEDPLAYSPLSSATIFAPLKLFGEQGEAAYNQILKQRGPWAALFYPPSARAFNQGTLFYADQVEDINPGVLHWLASIAPTTVLGSYLFSKDPDLVYGSAEHLKEARHYNFAEDLGVVGKKLAEALPEELSFLGGPAMAAGVTASILLMLFEPDPITLATLPYSTAVKGTKLAARGLGKTVTGAAKVGKAIDVLRLDKYDNLLAKALDDLESGKIENFSEIPKFFREEGAGELADMYDALMVNEWTSWAHLRTNPSEKRKFSAALTNSRENLKKLREQITKEKKIVGDTTARYIEAYGKVHHKGAEATPAQYALLKSKQEATIEEVLQTAAALEEAEFKLRQAGALAGVKYTHGNLEAGHRTLLANIEEGLTAHQRLQKNLDAITQLELRAEKLRGYPTLSAKQADELATIEATMNKLAEANAADRVLTRRMFLDGGIEGLYQNFKAAQEAYEGSLTHLAKYFTSGEELLKATTLVRKLEKKLKKAKKVETQEGLAQDLIKARALVQKNLDDLLKITVKDAPTISLGHLKKGHLRKVKAEIKLKALSNMTDSVRPVVNTLRNSINAYKKLLKGPTEQVAPVAPQIISGGFIRVDPSDPTRFLLDQEAYRNVLKSAPREKATDEMFTLLMNQNDVFRRLIRGTSTDPLSLSRSQVQLLTRIEQALITATQATKTEDAAIASSVVNLWKSPELSSQVLFKMNGSNPVDWAKTFVTGATGVLLRKANLLASKVDPLTHRTAPVARNIQETTLIASTRTDRANEEITLLFDQWVRNKANLLEELTGFLTTTRVFNIEFRGQKVVGPDGLGAGAVAVTNQGERTPWEKFRSYILDTPDAAKLVRGTDDGGNTTLQANLALKALAYAFIPRASKATEPAGELLNATFNLIRENRSFEEVIAGIKIATEKQFPGLPVESVDRAMAFIAKGVLHGAVVEDFLIDLSRATGPAMTEEAALGANFILGQTRGKVVGLDPADRVAITSATQEFRQVGAEYGFDPTAAFNAFAQWGMRFDQPRFALGFRKLKEYTLELSQVTKSADPLKAQFAPKALIDRIEKQAGKIAKDLEQITLADGVGAATVNAFWNYLRWWRKSVIMGITFPRAAYFSNQIAGDFSQLWMTESLLSVKRVQIGKDKGKIYVTGAAPLIFQNAFTYIPYYGTWTQDYLVGMGKAASKSGTRPWLTSPLNALFNGHITQVYRMSDEVADTFEGERTYKVLMQEAMEDGVFDTLMTEDLYKIMNQQKPPSYWGKFQNVANGAGLIEDYSRYWGDMITTIQGRQRMALYLEYRCMRGESRAASKQAVHNSFYDWKYGVTDWEMQTIGKFIAFYPFFRLAGKQMGRALLEPFTRPLEESVRKAMIGQTQIGRVRAQANIVNTVPNYVWGDDEDRAMSEWEIIQEAQKSTSPWYVGARPVISNDLMSQDDRDWWLRNHGREYTHYSTLMPMWTALDMMDLYRKLFEGIGGFMLGAATGGQIRPTADSNKLISQTGMDFLNPIFKGAATGVWDKFSNAPVHKNPLGKRVRPGEEDIYTMYSKVPLLLNFVEPIPGEKGYYVNRAAVDSIRALPIFGTEIPSLYAMSYGANPKWQKGATAGMSHMLRHWTGIARRMPYNPEEALRYNRQDIAGSFKEKQRRLNKIAESKGGPRQRYKVEEE
jgi:hypothetical protein